MIRARFKFVDHSKTVLDREERRNRRVLFKQGAYVARSMKRSMRYRKGASKPGQPPSAHRNTGAGLREGISFNVDPEAGSVIIGPDLKSDSKVAALKPLPELLNEGGDITLEIDGESVRAHIAPRPCLAPVFTDGGENLRKLIENEPL